jgi:dienelactone hydrolase
VPCAPAVAESQNGKGNAITGAYGLVEVRDPNTYSALAYSPATIPTEALSTYAATLKKNGRNKLPPLILVLHGAGQNKQDAWELADIQGEHAGLIPSLIASGSAPAILTDSFCVLAPYSFGKLSFYEEPRSKILKFLDWASSEEGRMAGCPVFDPPRVILFGFSDGATVAVELLTTGRFAAGVIAYG